MSFTGNEGKQITLEEGALLTQRYRDSGESTTKGLFVGRTHLEAILAQADCKGVRMYLGKNANLEPELVLVGADSNENDMLGMIVDNVFRCPPCGSVANPLNGNELAGGSR